MKSIVPDFGFYSIAQTVKGCPIILLQFAIITQDSKIYKSKIMIHSITATAIKLANRRIYPCLQQLQWHAMLLLLIAFLLIADKFILLATLYD